MRPLLRSLDSTIRTAAVHWRLVMGCSWSSGTSRLSTERAEGDHSLEPPRDLGRGHVERLHQRQQSQFARESSVRLTTAGRSRYNKLGKALLSFGARPTEADPSLYTISREGTLGLKIAYVDIIIMSKSKTPIAKIKGKLANRFDAKDPGPVKNCLGIEFTESKDGILLQQKGVKKGNVGSVPHVPGGYAYWRKRQAPQSWEWRRPPSSKEFPYRGLVASVTYLSIATRPDISFTFNSCHDSSHWAAGLTIPLRNCRFGYLDKFSGYRLKSYIDSESIGELCSR